MIELKSQTAKGRTPEQKWANASDAALRDSIRAGAYDHMMGHDSFDQLVRYVAYAIYAIHPVGTAMLAYNEGAGLACLAIILAGHIGIRGIIAKANKKETGSYEFDRVRWDIAGMDGIAPDRYALTRVATAIPRLLYAKK
jgi:hypothetical protein